MPHEEHHVEPPNPAAEKWLAEHVLADGRVIRFRHVRPDDEPLITASIRTASRETLLHRFFSPIRNVPPELMRRMLEIDAQREICVVGVMRDGDKPSIRCGARYVKLAVAERAEIALTVHDTLQHQGVGTYLLRLLATLARLNGIIWFEADVMESNQKMLNLFDKVTAWAARRQWRVGAYHLTMPVDAIAPVRLLVSDRSLGD